MLSRLYAISLAGVALVAVLTLLVGATAGGGSIDGAPPDVVFTQSAAPTVTVAIPVPTFDPAVTPLSAQPTATSTPFFGLTPSTTWPPVVPGASATPSPTATRATGPTGATGATPATGPIDFTACLESPFCRRGLPSDDGDTLSVEDVAAGDGTVVASGFGDIGVGESIWAASAPVSLSAPLTLLGPVLVSGDSWEATFERGDGGRLYVFLVGPQGGRELSDLLRASSGSPAVTELPEDVRSAVGVALE